MALLNRDKFRKIEKERNYVHEEVDSTYCVFIDNTGQKFFQIDTYGRKGRKYKGKVSQTIQLDHNTAKYLCKVIKEEFGMN